MKVILLLSIVSLGLGSKPSLICKSNNRRITNGCEIDIKTAPYQVSLRYKGEHGCGGSIISESFILSAAHCTFGYDKKDFEVCLGSSDRTKCAKLRRVAKIINHPDYDETIENYDICLIKMEKPIKFTENMRAVKLPRKTDRLEVKTQCLVTGWGDKKHGSGQPYPVGLRGAEVTIVSDAECEAAYGKEYDKKTMLGAGGDTHDSCQGDSGGPLAANGTLYGIVSSGIGCGVPGIPGLYTKVQFFHSWITKNMKN